MICRPRFDRQDEGLVSHTTSRPALGRCWPLSPPCFGHLHDVKRPPQDSRKGARTCNFERDPRTMQAPTGQNVQKCAHLGLQGRSACRDSRARADPCACARARRVHLRRRSSSTWSFCWAGPRPPSFQRRWLHRAHLSSLAACRRKGTQAHLGTDLGAVRLISVGLPNRRPEGRRALPAWPGEAGCNPVVVRRSPKSVSISAPRSGASHPHPFAQRVLTCSQAVHLN